MEVGAIVTIALFAAGVIYQTGRLSNRVEELTNDVVELKGEITKLRDALNGLSMQRPWGRSQ